MIGINHNEIEQEVTATLRAIAVDNDFEFELPLDIIRVLSEIGWSAIVYCVEPEETIRYLPFCSNTERRERKNWCL